MLTAFIKLNLNSLLERVFCVAHDTQRFLFTLQDLISQCYKIRFYNTRIHKPVWFNQQVYGVTVSFGYAI